MKQYIVKQMDDVTRGAPLGPDVSYGIYEAMPHGHTAIAYTHTRATAERIAQLLNEDEMRRELDR